VCPVGAIYEHDQTAEVRAALNDSSRKTIAQISPALAAAVNDELALAAGTVTAGKLTAAVKLLGFDKVYDAAIAANAVNLEIAAEVKQRENSSRKTPQSTAKLPVISGCTEGVANFINNSYPDLAGHLTATKNPRRYFASVIKDSYAKEAEVESSVITSVSFVACLAHKYKVESLLPTPHSPFPTNDFALTAGELVRMLKLAGIVIETLPEEPFNSANIELPAQESGLVKKETVHGYAQARKVMEAIREGKCDAQWVEICNCTGGNCTN